ncbi:hypothetical protein CLOM_g17548, partial [Closterium sp. NIES-68]
ASPPFDPEASKSNVPLTCADKTCVSMSFISGTAAVGCGMARSLPGDADACEYAQRYGTTASGGSGVSGVTAGTTEGRLLYDIVWLPLRNGTLTKTYVIFGCGSYQTGSLSGVSRAPDGVFGLGRGIQSIVSVAAGQGVWTDSFALCLEGDPYAFGSYVVLGTSLGPTGAHWTSFIEIADSPLYFIHITGMSVAGTPLAVAPRNFRPPSPTGEGGAVLDSSTTFTEIPGEVYRALITAVFEEVGGFTYSKEETAKRSLMCYVNMDIASNDPAAFFQRFPTVTVHLAGNAEYLLFPQTYLLASPPDGLACFAAVRSPSLRTVLAESWLRNKYIWIEREKGVMAWTDVNCTTNEPITSTPPTPAPAAPAPPPPLIRLPSPAPINPPPSLSPPPLLIAAPSPPIIPNLPPTHGSMRSPPPVSSPPPPSYPPPDSPPPAFPPPPAPGAPASSLNPPYPLAPSSPPEPCTSVSPTDCDCFFEGNDGSIATFPLSSAFPDSPISPNLLCRLGFGGGGSGGGRSGGEGSGEAGAPAAADGGGGGGGESYSVGSANVNRVEVVCGGSGAGADASNQFYFQGPRLAARTFQPPLGAAAYAGATVRVSFSSMQLSSGSLQLNLNAGDATAAAALAEDRRCVLFSLS